MIAILDCNSFYCSCERVFRPTLAGKPVAVLSNNDGCIIARSDEAKDLGVGMASPYFLNKEIIKKHDVAIFSSNYNLYGNMSWRVMETLRMLVGANNVEVYSVDEAFVNLEDVPQKDLEQFVFHIKDTVEMWTGIKVSVGVAPTKVLAKVANRLAKKDKETSKCVMIIDTPEKIADALKQTKVEDVWGVGHQNAEKLRNKKIFNAYDLSIHDLQWVQKFLGGVVGLRLVRELRGEQCIFMEKQLETKKMIMTTRMFGAPVTDINDIKEAVATYTSRAAEKLRRQNCVAKSVGVFIVPKEASNDNHFSHGPTVSAYAKLTVATSLTHELIKLATKLVDEIYKKGRLYKKAGVMLSDILPAESVQGDLFVVQNKKKEKLLMEMMDNMNFSMRNDVLKFASSGLTRNWKMQQNFNSPRYTSRWHEIYNLEDPEHLKRK